METRGKKGQILNCTMSRQLPQRCLGGESFYAAPPLLLLGCL